MPHKELQSSEAHEMTEYERRRRESDESLGTLIFMTGAVLAYTGFLFAMHYWM